MIDVNPFPIKVALSDLPNEEGSGWFGSGKKNDENDEEEVWSKEATIFKSFGRTGVKKTIAFTRETDIHCAMSYAESDILPEGTNVDIVRYNVSGIAEFAAEMEKKGLGKPKISLQFELSTSGIASLLKAEAAVEEITIVEEEVEIEDDEEDEKAEAEESESEKDSEKKEDAAEADADAEETDEKVEPKKKKTKMVEKEKKKVHKRSLNVVSYHIGKVQPYSASTMEESEDKLLDLAMKDKERIMLEESRNKVESYIYFIKNKLSDDEEEISKVTTEEQRSSLLSMAMEAEDWLYEDGYDADLATCEDKYAEISGPAEEIFFRQKEMTARPEAVAALRVKLSKIEDLMTKWESEKPQVTEEERTDVLGKVEDVRKWIADKEELQESSEPTETPAFTSAEVPLQTKSIETMVSRLSRKPKPKPVEEPKNETESEDKEEASEEAESEPEPEASEETEEEAEETEASEEIADGEEL